MWSQKLFASPGPRGVGSCCSRVIYRDRSGSPLFIVLGLDSEKGRLFGGCHSFLLNKPFLCWLLGLEKFI